MEHVISKRNILWLSNCKQAIVAILVRAYKSCVVDDNIVANASPLEVGAVV